VAEPVGGATVTGLVRLTRMKRRDWRGDVNEMGRSGVDQ